MRPMISTSSPNSAPASGVPNTDAKPALMPAISRTRRSSGRSRNRCVSWSASAPPICTAVPSRPTDAPNRCDTTVPPSTSGAMRSGTTRFGSWISSMSRLLPASTDWPNLKYTQPTAKPATGSSQITCGWSSRQRVAWSSAKRKNADALPARQATIPASTSHLPR